MKRLSNSLSCSCSRLVRTIAIGAGPGVAVAFRPAAVDVVCLYVTVLAETVTVKDLLVVGVLVTVKLVETVDVKSVEDAEVDDDMAVCVLDVDHVEVVHTVVDVLDEDTRHSM